jgi:hypothetical protein
VDLNKWFRQRLQRQDAPRVADGWTDDLSVQLPAGRTVEELVDYIFTANRQRREHEMLVAELAAEFGLSKEDAELSVDRVCGGVVRAAAGNRANCPDRVKDPVAWASFQRAIAKR